LNQFALIFEFSQTISIKYSYFYMQKYYIKRYSLQLHTSLLYLLNLPPGGRGTTEVVEGERAMFG